MSALFTIEWPAGKPTLREAAAALHMEESGLDPQFGVVSIDPARHLFAVRTRGDDAGAGSESAGVKGPFADPKIEAFGPVRKR
jgi:hypothetical protein